MFLDDLHRSFPLFSALYSLPCSRSMRLHMEGPSPTPETLRGVDAIDSSSPSDCRRRPKRASHGRAYGLDDTLSYCNDVMTYSQLTDNPYPSGEAQRCGV
jgi:hypothetical protein